MQGDLAYLVASSALIVVMTALGLIAVHLVSGRVLALCEREAISLSYPRREVWVRSP